MPDQLETIINELRGMREDMQRLGDSLLPNEPVLSAAVDVAKHYDAQEMCDYDDGHQVLVPIGDLRKLVTAIASVRH